MSTPKRKTVSLRAETFARAAKLRDERAMMGGPKATITDTIDRALHCLEDVEKRSAWVAPRDPALVAEDHIVTLISEALAQLIRSHMPDRELDHFEFDYNRRHLFVHFKGNFQPAWIDLTRYRTNDDPPAPTQAPWHWHQDRASHHP